ncbi:MAG: hypothetical protein HYU98_02570 [Deltaproteobacteria bacterium]|nr:hypothetical protein [Deltaproteobacteria bacterium]
MGLNGTGGANRYSVDIEASLIAAGYGSRLDGRLYEGVWSWIKLYGNIINKERLVTLVHKRGDEWIVRFLGALLENTDEMLWKGVIKKFRSMCSPSWKETPMSISADADTWHDKDPIMQKWGISCARLIPKQKMLEHNIILQNNIWMQYRYLYGATTRADVMYLLNVSHNCRNKREIDFLTSVRLADRLCCHPSTIYRIQEDLEKGGFIERTMGTWTIVVKNALLIESSEDYDVGTIDWVKINLFIDALLKLADELEVIDNEAILKSRIQAFQTNYFPILFLNHYIEAPGAYGSGLGPLEKYSIDQLFEMVENATRLFYRIVCREK